MTNNESLIMMMESSAPKKIKKKKVKEKKLSSLNHHGLTDQQHEKKSKKKSSSSHSLEQLKSNSSNNNTSNATKENVNNLNIKRKSISEEPITIPIVLPKKRVSMSASASKEEKLLSPRINNNNNNNNNNGASHNTRSASTGKRTPFIAAVKKEDTNVTSSLSKLNNSKSSSSIGQVPSKSPMLVKLASKPSQPPQQQSSPPNNTENSQESSSSAEETESNQKKQEVVNPKTSMQTTTTQLQKLDVTDFKSSTVLSSSGLPTTMIPSQASLPPPDPSPPPPVVIEETYISLFQNHDSLHKIFAKSKDVSTSIPNFWFYTPTYVPPTQWDLNQPSNFPCPNNGTLDELSFNYLTNSYNSIRQSCPINVLEKKRFCNPIPFITTFNKMQGEKTNLLLANEVSQEKAKTEQEADAILDYLKRRRSGEIVLNQKSRKTHHSSSKSQLANKQRQDVLNGTTKKKIKAQPRNQKLEKKKSVTLFETAKPRSNDQQRTSLMNQESSSATSTSERPLLSRTPSERVLTSSADLFNAPSLSRQSSRKVVDRSLRNSVQLNELMQRRDSIDVINNRAHPPKSRSLTSSPMFHFENKDEISECIGKVEEQPLISSSEARTTIASLLNEANVDLPKLTLCLKPLLEETRDKKDEELENVSTLYVLMKTVEKKSEDEYRSICKLTTGNNSFLEYLKTTITTCPLHHPEILQFVMKVVRKLSEYSCELLGYHSSPSGYQHFAKNLKATISDTKLIDMGFISCIVEKMDTLNEYLKQTQCDQNISQQDMITQEIIPDKTIYNIMRDMFHSVTCLSFSGTEARTKLLHDSPYFLIISSIFKMKRAPLLKTNVLICIERLILSGTTFENDEFVDDSTTNHLLELGLLSQIISDYNLLTLKARKGQAQKKKKQGVTLKQALYQVIRALSFHERAREEMYRSGFFHNLLSMMRELGTNNEDTEEETNIMKGLILDAISNFVPSSSIHRDTLILKYIFDTVVEMFVSVPVQSNCSNLLLETRTLHILSQLSDYTKTHQILFEARVVEHAFNLLQRDLNQQVFPEQNPFVVSMTSSTFLCMLLVSNLSKYKEGQRHIYDKGLTPIIRLLRLSSSIAEQRTRCEQEQLDFNIVFTQNSMSQEEYELLPKVISRTLANISTLPESHFTFFKEMFLDSLSTLIINMTGERTVIWNCLCTLSNLCEADTMLQRKLITKNGVRDCLVKYLLETDHKLQSRSVRCISKLARNETILTQIHDIFKIPNIVKAADSNSMDECKLDGLRILFHFSQFEQFHPSFLKSGAIEFMIKATYSPVESIVVESLKNLLNLIFANDKNIKEAITQAGTVDRLWDLKKSNKNSEKVRRLCLSALKAM
ncbi:hypothetical protein C9374_010003 [Naegleria lovaniensis]|uniref:Uncharacterized protein n=1 Tax=Naegleria lovaniensis TaxID=51637 RepID=A0AA88KE86_NAELO|nr:uncharacterized protein C9374_010003 [Naegleria lovaniensis]KAG2375380.1 hypothetical protein C9374_010003 [Naegleria lovaniensis]